MPELLKKSEQNIKAAKLLLENGGVDSPSIHCCYYACFQQLKNLMARAYFCDYEDFDREIAELRRSQNKKKIGTHEFFIDKKLSTYIKREHIADFRLVNDLNNLKKCRIDSDYKNTFVSPDKAEKAYSLSIAILKRLKRIQP